MVNLSAHTLMMAIQAVDAKTKQLTHEIGQTDDQDLSDLEEDMLAFSKAQMELKDIYIGRQKESDNLPPYEELV